MSSNEFDALTVAPSTILMSGASVKLVGKGDRYLCKEKDVINDGLDDLECKISIAEFLLDPGAANVILEAMTFTFESIWGQSHIEIVPQ